jgi:hypothetical protein
VSQSVSLRGEGSRVEKYELEQHSEAREA